MSSPTSQSLPKPLSPQLRRLVEFLDPVEGRTDHRGRRFAEIIKWTDNELEETHDYIQWLFPLTEPSMAVRSAPIMDSETVAYVRSNRGIGENMKLALARMLRFYGFEIKWPDVISERGERHIISKLGASGQRQFSRWLKPSDHNHLRISRIIRSLRYFGLHQEARSVYESFNRVNTEYGYIVRNSLQFWREAAYGSLGQ